MGNREPITERRWFAFLWGSETPLSDDRYRIFLIGAPILTVLGVLMIPFVSDGPWWAEVLYLVPAIGFWAQAIRERQRRVRERALRMAERRTPTMT